MENEEVKSTAEDEIQIEDREFLLYVDKVVTEDSQEKLKTFFNKYPKIKEELFNHTKNSMMATIYSKNQSRDYINWVIDTLKFMSKFF